MISLIEPAWTDALTRALNHSGPYSLSELKKYRGELTLQGVKSLAPLKYLPGVQALTLEGCEVPSLVGLTHLRNLTSLRIRGTLIGSYRSLVKLSKLQYLEVIGCNMKGLREVGQLPALRRGIIAGNPLSKKAFAKTRPELLSYGAKNNSRQTLPLIDFSSEFELESTRFFWEEGVNVGVLGHVGMRPRSAIRPGLATLPGPTFDWARIGESELIQALDEGGQDPQQTWSRAIEIGDGARPSTPPSFESEYEIGRPKDALAWIRSSAASAQEKVLLRRFVSQFPSVIFFRDTDTSLDELETHAAVKFPRWLRQVRRTLSFLIPEERVWVQFAQFDNATPPICERLDAQWYDLSLSGYANKERRALMTRNGASLFPIGEARESIPSTLAVQLQGNATTIFEFSEDNLRDLVRHRRKIKEGVRPAFQSYASMLANISAIRLRSGRVIQARRRGG